MRLIDADALLYDLEIVPLTGDGGVDANDLDDIIKRQPTIEERKKGKWILHKDWEYDGECAYECSVCGMGSDVDYDFCMRCGADMRGEE